jgi:hypothetical protein
MQQQQQQQQHLQFIPAQQGIRSPRHQARKRASHCRWPLQDGILSKTPFYPFSATLHVMSCSASIVLLVPFALMLEV